MNMRPSGLVLFAAAAVGLGYYSAPAQMPTGPQTGLNAAVLKLFGEFTSFSAQAEAVLLDGQQRETMRIPMTFAMLKGKVCTGINLSDLKNGQVAPQAFAHLQQLGMDRMITVVRPDLKSTLVIYPNLKSYAAIPMSADEVKELEAKYQISKHKLGHETVAGHPCVKYQVTITSPAGVKREALGWYASDLKGFPVQIQMHEEDSTVRMMFRNVQLRKPAAKAFEAPKGYARFASLEQLMQSAVAKKFGGAK